MRAARLMHSLRCAPCINHPFFHYSVLQKGISVITNSCLSDIHWLQASFPIRDGGLGIRRVSSLTLSAFLASAANTRDLQDRMLVACNVGVDTLVASTRGIWSSFNALHCPKDTDARRQRSSDEPNVTRDVNAICEGASSEMDKARLLASKAPHSSNWLYALPITACGLRLSDEAIRVAVGLRLGLNICKPHPCPYGATVTSRGTHGLSCIKKLWPLHSSPTDQRRDLEVFEACRCSLNKRTSRPTQR